MSSVTARRRLAALAALCAIVVAAWLFEFATHLHVPDRTSAAAHHIQHTCAFCASLSAGAAPSAVTSRVPFAAPMAVQGDVCVALPASMRIAAYCSRAPPVDDLV